MSDYISKKKILDWLDKDQKMVDMLYRDQDRELLVLTNLIKAIREYIESESSEDLLKSAVKALEDIKSMLDMDHSGYQKYLIWKKAFDALADIKKVNP